MGIPRLETFLRKKVQNGYPSINIIREITTYINNSNDPEPIIIIETSTFILKLWKSDIRGQICGGRFKNVYSFLDRFFTKLTQLGAKLVFFVRCRRLDPKLNSFYQRFLNIVDAVNDGADVTRVRPSDVPFNYDYMIKQLAKVHGIVKTTVDTNFQTQELVAYANSVGAFAIMTNSSSYLIFEGTWRLWSSKDIDIEECICSEYNREGLLQTLGLSYPQMAFFASIAGNCSIPYQQVKRFQSRFGPPENAFPELAGFVRQNWQAVNDPQKLMESLSQVFSKPDMESFCASMQHYSTNYIPDRNPMRNEIIDVLLSLDQSFPYYVWMGQPCNIITYFIDMRQSELGERFPDLIIPVIQRQAGIILFHQRNQRQITDVKLVIKMRHDLEHEEKIVSAQFPEDVIPPELLDLYSSDAELRENLFTTKLQLYCWIASNVLDHRVLETIPKRLQVTLTTLYFLVENNVLQLFEADLLLQVNYDVMDETYNFEEIEYPRHLESRAFHVIFMYEEFYNFFAEAFTLVGLDGKDFCNYPLLDGVLFHNKYAEWKEGNGNLEQIKSWRIYENILQPGT